jgi:hypothetical protein
MSSRTIEKAISLAQGDCRGLLEAEKARRGRNAEILRKEFGFSPTTITDAQYPLHLLFSYGGSEVLKVEMEGQLQKFLGNVRELLDGVTIEDRDNCGNTLLHCIAATESASTYGAQQFSIPDWLLPVLRNGGVDVNAVNGYGETALHLAASRKNYNVLATIFESEECQNLPRSTKTYSIASCCGECSGYAWC